MPSRFDRPDPFFATRKPHSQGYLESLHRTYGEPKGALPRRDDDAFQRAMAFREQEKAHYKTLEQENRRLMAMVEEMQRSNTELASETDKIKALFAQLSKPKTEDDVDDPKSPPKRRGGKAGVRAGAADDSGGGKRVAERPKSRRPPRRSDDVPRVDETDGGETGGEDDVRREVLPAALPDARGQATEHAAEGSESGGGAESAAADGESGDTIREDEK